MHIYKTDKEYYYKKYKNETIKRISKKDYNKYFNKNNKNKIMIGGDELENIMKSDELIYFDSLIDFFENKFKKAYNFEKEFRTKNKLNNKFIKFKEIIQFYLDYINQHKTKQHYLNIPSLEKNINIDIGEIINEGSRGIIYDIRNSNYSLKFMFETINDSFNYNFNLNSYLNTFKSSNFLLPIKNLLLYHNTKKVRFNYNYSNFIYLFTNKNNKKFDRFRVYLMKKIDYDLEYFSTKLLRNPKTRTLNFNFLFDPNLIRIMLNQLMQQINELMNISKLYEINGKKKYHNVQVFDLKYDNVGIIKSDNELLSFNAKYKFYNTYLIDFDSYLFNRDHSNESNIFKDYWISSFPPPEFYQKKNLIIILL